MSKRNRLLVFIPTYNEAGNISDLIKEIVSLKLDYDIHILVIDDSSTDGTIRIIRELQKIYKSLYLLIRREKMGIGSAHIEAFKWAYNKGFDILVTMDADFTHSPSYIPLLVASLSNFDVVIASRHLRGSKMLGWSWFRKSLTFLNHLFVKMFFSIDFDTSNAFRAYRINRDLKVIFDKISSNSYSFFFESLIYLRENAVKIGEVPIIMRERMRGCSKLAFRDIFVHIKVFLILFLRFCFARSSFKIDNE